MSPSPHRGSLARRQALQVGLLAIGALVLSGLTEMVFSYREAFEQTQALQAAQASAAAREIDQYLDAVTVALRDTTKSPWGAEGYTPQRRREEYLRVMVLFPAIAEVRVLAADGRELMALSRTEPDRVAAQGWATVPSTVQAARPLAARFGQPYFQNGSEPYVQVVLDGGNDPQRGEQLIATLHLRLVADVLARLDDAVAGRAFLVDGQNRLILHPVQTEMLKQRKLDDWPAVTQARAALGPSVGKTATLEVTDFEGHEVVSTATFVPKTGWLLFLEQPRAAVLAPAFETLRRTAILVALVGLLTAAVSAWSGRRMARPIVALRQASARIAGGDFDSPVVLKTGDELELLADDLNQMAVRLRRFYEELEAQVAERTLALTQARDMAERANQAKTRFLAAASHDLRQPMHTIGLLLGVLGTRLREPDQLVIAGKLGVGVDTMERLFSSLLDISKLDAGIVRAQVEPFPVQDVLNRLAQRFDVVAAERGLTLRVHRCSAVVRSDPGLLERCLGNLVANALNYTATGRVVIGCRLRGEALAIQVHDTGPGIAPDHLGDIFEEFVRLPDAEAASSSQGLGLGLAIVRRTAALLSHPLAVRSRVGRGSVFELCVARLADAVSSDSPLAVHDDVAALPAGLFVLVVDDDDGNRSALQALCVRWGCHVVVGASGEQAMAALAGHLRTPDLVLTDLRLGGVMDGLDLVAAVREAAEEAMPCLLITADTDAQVLERARAAGVGVLHKPATADRVLGVARAALTRRADPPQTM